MFFSFQAAFLLLLVLLAGVLLEMETVERLAVCLEKMPHMLVVIVGAFRIRPALQVGVPVLVRPFGIVAVNRPSVLHD